MYLVWSVALTLVLAVIAVSGATLEWACRGGKQNMRDVQGPNRTAARIAHVENLVLFAILVFAARFANVSNAMTLLGAQLFFWGRVAHAVIYIAGIPWLRTAAWTVSVIGLLLILWQLVA
jgi:uncharacterized MAPEG superfamily protein